MTRSAKDVLQSVLIWALVFWIACLCGVLVDWLLCTFIDGFWRGIGDFVTAILHAVFMGIGSFGVILALSFFLGYHDAGFEPSRILLDGLGGGVVQLLVAVLLKFPRWVSGGVLWLAGLLEYGQELQAEKLYDCQIWYYLLAYLLMLALYLLARLLGQYLGYRHRMSVRLSLTGSTDDPAKRDR